MTWTRESSKPAMVVDATDPPDRPTGDVLVRTTPLNVAAFQVGLLRVVRNETLRLRSAMSMGMSVTFSTLPTVSTPAPTVKVIGM